MADDKQILIENAVRLLEQCAGECIFLFLNTHEDCLWFINNFIPKQNIVLVIPQGMEVDYFTLKQSNLNIIRSWAGNQSRFSRIKYAFMHGVLNQVITESSKVICVLGPWGTSHLDTLTIHDLKLSWSEDFPFDPRRLIDHHSFHIVMAMVDIAMDISTFGREGKAVGTSFVIGDTETVLHYSHQAVFNPFRGYKRHERHITRPEVVESLKELAQLDGAILISEEGYAVAAGRHLNVTSSSPIILPRGFGSRHRAAAAITNKSNSVAIVVSASSGKITIFEKGRTIITLEAAVARRVI